MKRFLSGILLASGGLAVAPQLLQTAIAQKTSDDLFYTYYDQKIELTRRQDVIAVAFKPATRGSNVPQYLRLQQSLQQNTRGETLKNVEIEPLGRYALVMVRTRGERGKIEQRIQQQAFVETTLPVVTRRDRTEAIVLPNEVIVSFEAIANSQQQAILKQQNLEIIRPLRFSQNRYLVKSKSASGTAILNVANQLNSVNGVKSATPNFVQPRQNELPATVPNLQTNKIAKTPFQTTLLPLQWHLNSTPLSACMTQAASQPLGDCIKQNFDKSRLARTDLRVTDAWQKSNAGKGVVVAVLDSIIQWDHPDLINSLYSANNVKDKLPGEVHGWDFADNDPDTRISNSELARLRPSFQDSFALSDAELLQKYASSAQSFQQNNPDASKEQIVNSLRNDIRMQSAGIFHGTWVSGVIAARSTNGQGLVGVAPNAQILPVCVGKESPNTVAIVEGIGYAAARGADVINMSFSVPVEDVADAILEVQQNSNLVLVAAAGNQNVTEVGFPAGMNGVISVGASSLTGNRAPYSNFGKGLDVVAPGGDSYTQLGTPGGILTTGGVWVDGFWQGIVAPTSNWGAALDPKGKYMWVDGTSFASPAVAGVVALMIGEDRSRRLDVDGKRLLDRDRLINILKETASFDGLKVSEEEIKSFESQVKEGTLPESITIEQYYFGNGLVNADAAVAEVKRSL